MYDLTHGGACSARRICRPARSSAPPISWSHGCQMALARFLDRICLALLASGLWLRYATLQNLISSFPWIAPPHPPPWLNPRKGRDQILPSGKLGSRISAALRNEPAYRSVARYKLHRESDHSYTSSLGIFDMKLD